MLSALRPCPSCGRHVRIQDAACPFCATALRDSASLLAKALAAGVLVLTVQGCDAGKSGDNPVTVPAYGPPPFDPSATMPVAPYAPVPPPVTADPDIVVIAYAPPHPPDDSDAAPPSDAGVRDSGATLRHAAPDAAPPAPAYGPPPRMRTPSKQ